MAIFQGGNVQLVKSGDVLHFGEPVERKLCMNNWIFCSERLPDKHGRYLVVYPLFNDELFISILRYGRPDFPEKKKPCFYYPDDEWGDVEYDDVIAWMPLPELPPT